MLQMNPLQLITHPHLTSWEVFVSAVARILNSTVRLNCDKYSNLQQRFCIGAFTLNVQQITRPRSEGTKFLPIL